MGVVRGSWLHLCVCIWPRSGYRCATTRNGPSYPYRPWFHVIMACTISTNSDMGPWARPWSAIYLNVGPHQMCIYCGVSISAGRWYIYSCYIWRLAHSLQNNMGSLYAMCISCKKCRPVPYLRIVDQVLCLQLHHIAASQNVWYIWF